ncbi:hypothetical protein GWD52_09595 [Enterobacteriaceae bacterium 4M9]|nr:hypothetical protein [Enterobacteriaceae bacterium 4M9]
MSQKKQNNWKLKELSPQELRLVSGAGGHIGPGPHYYYYPWGSGLAVGVLHTYLKK